MSQRLLYRTACFIFGFGIGVIYFASPSGNHQLVEADGLSASEQRELERQAGLQQPAASREENSDLQSLQAEAAALAALEANLVGKLAGTAVDDEAIVPAEDSVVSESASIAKLNAEQTSAPIENQQKIEALESIAEELASLKVGQTEVQKVPAEPADVHSLPAQDPAARAQLKRLPVRVPTRISRKVFFLEHDGASFDEQVMEIDVATGTDANALVPFDFDQLDSVSKLIPTSPSAQAVEQPRGDPAESVAVAEVSEQGAVEADLFAAQESAMAQQVTSLKQDNLEMREQLLSLRVLFQAMQDEPQSAEEGIADQYDVEGPATIRAPQVMRVTKQSAVAPTRSGLAMPKAEMFEQSERELMPVRNRAPHQGSFESRPGDPVLVRYDRTPLRTGPGTNYSRVAILRKGTQLTVDYHRDGWFRVYTEEGVRAWIAQDALQWF